MKADIINGKLYILPESYLEDTALRALDEAAGDVRMVLACKSGELEYTISAVDPEAEDGEMVEPETDET